MSQKPLWILYPGLKVICITMSGWDTLSDHDLDLLEEGSVCSKYDRYAYIFISYSAIALLINANSFSTLRFFILGLLLIGNLTQVKLVS